MEPISPSMTYEMPGVGAMDDVGHRTHDNIVYKYPNYFKLTQRFDI